MTLTPALTEFIQRTGIVLQGEIPRGAAEAFALLAVTPEALTIDEIASALRHSRAGVSASIRILEAHGVVERVARPGDRRDHYALTSNPFQRVLARAAQRFRDLAELARTASCEAPRLREMTKTFERASQSLEQWRNA